MSTVYADSPAKRLRLRWDMEAILLASNPPVRGDDGEKRAMNIEPFNRYWASKHGGGSGD